MRAHGAVACVMLLAALAGCVVAEDEVADGSAADDAVGTLTENIPLPTSLEWVRLPDMLLPRAEHWACNFDHRIYLIGGFILASPVANALPTAGIPAGGAPIPTNLVEIYDAKANTMTRGPDYPVNLDHAPCVGHNGTIYVINGQNSYKLTPDKEDQWIRIAPPPNSHSAGEAVLWGDKIIAAGGRNVKVDVYDIATDTWTTMEADVPTRRDHTAGAFVLGKFYLVAGDTAGHSVNTDVNEAYDPEIDNWTVKAPVPVKRGSIQAVAWYDRVVVMGGQSGASGTPAYNDMNVYDPVTDTWDELPPMPAGRHGFGAAVWDHNIYLFGGAPKQDIYGFAEVHALVAG